MEENQVKEKKGWSWLGFFFTSIYYAGYGKVGKGIILAIIGLIPLVPLIVGIYGGVKAKSELPIKNQNFNWIYGIILIVLNIVLFIIGTAIYSS